MMTVRRVMFLLIPVLVFSCVALAGCGDQEPSSAADQQTATTTPVEAAVPQDLVGKWVSVKGFEQGGMLEFNPDGTCTQTVAVGGENTFDIIVEGDQIDLMGQFTIEGDTLTLSDGIHPPDIYNRME